MQLFEKIHALCSNFLWGAEEGMGVLVLNACCLLFALFYWLYRQWGQWGGACM